MIPAGKRAARYRKKVRGMVLPGQRQGFAGAVGGQVATENAVRAILARHGVMVGLHHYYMDFAKLVKKAQGNYSGETMRSEVIGLQNKWAERGLDVAVLDEIKGWSEITGLPFRLDHSLLDGPDVLA